MGNLVAVAEDSALVAWKYQENRQVDKHRMLPKWKLFATQESWMGPQNLQGRFSEFGTPFVRDAFKSDDTVQLCVDTLCPCSVNVDVRNKDWIESHNMTTLLTVSESSAEAPYFIEMNYCGGEVGEWPILLFGNGSTLLCLENGEQRASMAGAACSIASMRAAAAFEYVRHPTFVWEYAFHSVRATSSSHWMARPSCFMTQEMPGSSCSPVHCSTRKTIWSILFVIVNYSFLFGERVAVFSLHSIIALLFFYALIFLSYDYT